MGYYFIGGLARRSLGSSSEQQSPWQIASMLQQKKGFAASIASSAGVESVGGGMAQHNFIYTSGSHTKGCADANEEQLLGLQLAAQDGAGRRKP
ncbi:hypothetical protein, variant [Blastomyces gilchristii SLH14081]|uniref:Uncharacterized protein n=1 Tax=Blastomyces gilchristii (strain SLH14081) TaxID=559298 RepID=A0A179UQP7_BLAGS|nr:uncharacterized protein BDBG_05794 [Blastomyces gilchristii SLH14081]XP_031579164.1 hypothetical protein, variant [Blastomyces gilchristii SLH14081]OAT10113.1 hypothetical protein BDBG_05794 [Blastomyces gilchristii SLH14081]OAT10114.1 hypothetical protein, variant [Blastomyces gilchristii SLH14081]